MNTIAFTGERIVPGQVSEQLFREHEVRYCLAGTYAQGKIVLDIACGTGIGTDYLLSVGASKCIGVDRDVEALDYASVTYPRCEFKIGDAGSLPLASSSVEMVVSFETIEHLPDASTFIDECWRVLKPEGVFVCSTPNRAVYKWHGENPYHTREFVPAEFIYCVSQRFDVLQCLAQNTTLYPLYVGKRLTAMALEKLGVWSHFKKYLIRGTETNSARMKFGVDSGAAGNAITLYQGGWLYQPHYVILVAKRAAVR